MLELAGREYVDRRWPGAILLPGNHQAHVLINRLLLPVRPDTRTGNLPFSWQESFTLARELECDDPVDATEKAACVFSALTDFLNRPKEEEKAPYVN